jgi:serine/threonine-protein kinase
VIGVPSQVKVPNLVGQKADVARGALAKSELTVGKVTERDSERSGVVLEQDPEAEKEVPPGTPVNLVIGTVKVGTGRRRAPGK